MDWTTKWVVDFIAGKIQLFLFGHWNTCDDLKIDGRRPEGRT